MNSATGPRIVPTIIRQADQDITSVREALGIATPAPVVLISGGADTFDPAIAPKLTRRPPRPARYPGTGSAPRAPRR